MSSNLIKQVKEKQETIRTLQKEQERKQGRKEQLLKQLKEKFDVKTLEEAKSLLEDYEHVRKSNEESLKKIDKELTEIISEARARTTD